MRVYLRSVEARHIDGHGKYDGGGLLGGYASQSLKISQLQGVWRLLDDLGRHLQGTGGLLLSLSSDHLVK